MEYFTVRLLTELAEDVQRMDSKVLITESMCYYDYYHSGKVTLSFNKELKALIDKHKYVGMIPEEKSYLVGLDRGNGDISVKLWK